MGRWSGTRFQVTELPCLRLATTFRPESRNWTDVKMSRPHGAIKGGVIACPVSASHTRTDPSMQEVATQRLSGLNVAFETCPLWSNGWETCLPVRKSQTQLILSSPAVT